MYQFLLLPMDIVDYMKVSKSQALIYIYSVLLDKGEFTKEDIQSVVSISDISFRRYIQEIRAYLINFNEQKELLYDRKHSKYILVNIVF